MSLGVVTWRWTPAKGYRSSFSAETVNVLRRMVARHYPHPHRFLCVTDDAVGFDPEIEVVTPWNDFADVPSPAGSRQPSCYRRLRAFAPDIAETFGERFVSLDLDCVITGDLTPLWNRDDDCVVLKDSSPAAAVPLLNGSMFLLRAGTRPQVWQTFDPKTSPTRAAEAGYRGSDQAWMTYALDGRTPQWTSADGVYSFRNELVPYGAELPAGARIVFFHGAVDPWSPAAQAIEWVRDAWR